MRLIRDFPATLELRDADDGGLPDIVGIAAPFYSASDPGTEYALWQGAIERIMPTAFDSSLADNDDVVATYNHNVDNLLARTRAGTLTMTKGERGLTYRVRGKDTLAYRELITNIERGDVYGSSFTFSLRAGGSEWSKEGDLDVRELHSVKLFELGPVVSPAYESTATGLRSDEQVAEAMESLMQWRAYQERHRIHMELAKRRFVG